MRHDALKIQIKIAQATTRIQRAEATKLIRKGRDLRKQAESETDQAKKTRLEAQGWDCRSRSRAFRSEANDGRQDRRYMHLAAALLNGRTYNQCEAKCDPQNKPSAQALGAAIKPFLPQQDQAHAHYIAEMWLKDGTIKVRQMLEKGLTELRALDKQIDGIKATERSLKLAEQALTSAKSQVIQSRRMLQERQAALVLHEATAVKAEETLAGFQEQLTKQQADLRRAQEQIAARKGTIRTMDDLFTCYE